MTWSLVSRVQTHKAKDVSRFAGEFQAADSVKVAQTLNRRLEIEGRSLDVRVQINTSGEASKVGPPPGSVGPFIHEPLHYSCLRIRG